MKFAARLPGLLILAVTSLSAVAVALWLTFGLQSPTPARAATITVNIGNNWYCDATHHNNVCVTNVNIGDTVEWNWTTTNRSHSTTEDSVVPVWDSGEHTGPHMFDER